MRGRSALSSTKWGPPTEGTGEGAPRRGRKEPPVRAQRGDAHEPLRESRAGGANNGRRKGKGEGLVGSAGACGSLGCGARKAALAVPCRTTLSHGVAGVRRNGW